MENNNPGNGSGTNWANATKDELMQELYELEFAAKDMVEYLDSHPEDKSALATIQEISSQQTAVHKAYVEKFGPLQATDITPGNEWLWAMQNFPWDF